MSVHQVDHWPSKSAPQSQSVRPGAKRSNPLTEARFTGSLQVGKGSVINIRLIVHLKLLRFEYLYIQSILSLGRVWKVILGNIRPLS